MMRFPYRDLTGENMLDVPMGLAWALGALRWPSMIRWSPDALLSNLDPPRRSRNVHNILDRLRIDGAITVETPGGGRGVTTRYRLSLNSDSLNPNSVNSKTVNARSKKPYTAFLETVNSSSGNGEISHSAIRKNLQ